MSLFLKKPLSQLINEVSPTENVPLASEAQVPERTLKRTLGAWNLVALGIGGIIGAGLFVRTAAAIAERAGPSVVLAFVVAGIGCAFAGLCYAEFASMIPVAGSAYTYSYATMGEFVAWIIGWDLIIEYGVGNIALAISWAAYFRQLLLGMGVHVPAWMATDYRSAQQAAHTVATSGVDALGPEAQVAWQAHLDHPVI